MWLNKKNIELKIINLIERPLVNNGYQLTDIKLRRHSITTVEVYIDKIFNDHDSDNKGITHDDCKKVTDLISPILDVEELIKEQYTLEVSSPGINRTITNIEHFAQYKGKQVIIKTDKEYQGIIFDLDNDKIVLDIPAEETKVIINYENIKKANLFYDFNNITNSSK